MPSPNLVPPSPLSLGPSSVGVNVGPLKPPRKKRNFIVVNDIEIELDDDEEEEEKEEPKSPMTPLPSSSSSAIDIVAPASEKPTTTHPPEPSFPPPPSALPPSPSSVPTKPPLTTLSLPRLPLSPPPTLKIKATSPPPNLTGTAALHAPICFKRANPPSASSSLCKTGSGGGGRASPKPKSGSGGSCKGGVGFSSPSSSPLLVPSAS